MRSAALLLAAVAACPAATVGDGLVRLENAAVAVEVSPALAGRIVSLKRPGGAEMLAFVQDLRRRDLATLPQAASDGAYLHSGGSVVWLGPQRAWWAGQDGNPARRDARATWPPDPWLEYAAMTVVERTADHVVLQGQASRVSGIALRTRIAIAGDGAVVQAIEAVNASARSVAWDIWPNTRARPDARVFAPFDAQTRLRLEHSTFDPAVERQLPTSVEDGYLSFETALAPAVAGRLHTGKAFIVQARPRLFAAVDGELLIMAGSAVDPAQVHPDHAPVEVFQCAGGDPVRALLELEFHAPYRTLEPGASMRTAVAWRVVPLAVADPSAVRGHEPDAARLGQLAAAAAR